MSISPKIAPKLTSEMSSPYIYETDKIIISVPLKFRILYDTVIRDLPDHRWKILFTSDVPPLLTPSPYHDSNGNEYWHYSCGTCGKGLACMFSDCC